MGISHAHRTIALGLAFLLPGCMVEQILIGQWDTINTPPSGGCPPLIWRFVADPQRSIAGNLSRDSVTPIARLAGLLNPDDSFRIEATAVTGGQTATVTGRFTSQVSTIEIHGDAAGQACDGQVFNLRLGGYFPFQGGGGGGR